MLIPNKFNGYSPDGVRLYHFSGGGGGGGPSQQTVTQTNLPEYARPYFENLLQRGQAESYRDYTPYQGQRIAGFTPGETATQYEVMGMQTPGQFGAATGATTSGTALGLGAATEGLGSAFTDPTQMMSPYMQGVVDVQKRQALEDAQKTQLGSNLASARQGTYGGSRQLLAQTEREKALGQQMGDIQARGLQSAYDAAAQRGQMLGQLGLQGLQAGIGGAGQLGQLGTAEQQADLERIRAQATVGAEQRGLEQQQLDTAYADFLRQRDYPMEQLGYFSNILRGVPVGLGSTQTTYAAPPSVGSQIAGAGLSALGLYNMGRR
jgi:hypothetical protein